MESIKDKLSVIAKRFKLHGVPLCYLRDPITRVPSVSLTLLMISAHVVLYAWYKNVDFDNALQFFWANAALYFGRGLTDRSGTEIKKDKGDS